MKRRKFLKLSAVATAFPSCLINKQEENLTVSKMIENLRRIPEPKTININGKEYYVMFANPRKRKNPIFGNGILGNWDGVMLINT